MLKHKCVPDDFGLGVIIPLVKDTDGDTGNSENYRGITFNSVISKVFETYVLGKCFVLQS